MLLQDVQAKTPLFESYCPTNTPCVFSQNVLTGNDGPVIDVSVVVYSSVNSRPTLKELAGVLNKGGIPCLGLAMQGLISDDGPQQYFYLSMSLAAKVGVEGIFVCVQGDSEGNKRGTVSIPDSIGNS